MPSALHEVLVEIFRNAPHILAGLLGGRLQTVDFHDARFETDERNFSQLPDLDSDLVLRVLDPSRTLRCALVIEIQLRRDHEKERAWPAYQADLHRRLRCPTFVVVVAIEPHVARWATGPFCTGQTSFQPIVIGPEHLPIITDHGHAAGNVEFTLLSGLAHPNAPEAGQIGAALRHALDQDPSKHHDLYWDLFLGAVGEATRRKLMIQFEHFEPQSEWGWGIYGRGKAEGEAVGKRQGRLDGESSALLVLLQARGLLPGPELRARITTCRNLETLREWLRRAAIATRLGEVFDP